MEESLDNTNLNHIVCIMCHQISRQKVLILSTEIIYIFVSFSPILLGSVSDFKGFWFLLSFYSKDQVKVPFQTQSNCSFQLFLSQPKLSCNITYSTIRFYLFFVIRPKRVFYCITCSIFLPVTLVLAWSCHSFLFLGVFIYLHFLFCLSYKYYHQLSSKEPHFRSSLSINHTGYVILIRC